MKICVVQSKAINGDIEKNIQQHLKVIDRAISYGVDVIVFPELSITGYESSLSKELAILPGDHRLTVFQKKAIDHHINICVGIPTKNSDDTICISMLIFQTNEAVQIYSKKYLHIDEMLYFKSGQNDIVLQNNLKKISFAICYEISIPEHAKNANHKGAKIYIASVAKTVDGVKKASEHLSNIAKKYSMLCFMSNAIGHSDNFECGGRSAIWDEEGNMIGQLEDKQEGILIFNLENREVLEENYSKASF